MVARAIVAPDRVSHWVKANHQCRIPTRWIALDTESRVKYVGQREIQSWGMGAAIRWRTDLKTGDHAEAKTFDSALELWTWVTEFCKPRCRTVAYQHNLGHDVRISQALEVLPELGWHLEWCNLDRNVSAMTWRGDNGTLVLADTWTWLPMPLATVAPTVGLRKLQTPPDNAKHYRWERYCMRDAEIVYRVASQLVAYIASQDLGNWQPTGAGMSYATWRHKFMSHKVLVHDDTEILAAERAAMHTGRAEAWKHGLLEGDTWSEVDMRNAYVTICAECDLPTKLKFTTGAISNAQFRKLSESYRTLCRCRITTDVPCVPCHHDSRTIWPVGTFETWLWDTEVSLALSNGAIVSIREAIVYTRSPILRDWARWVLSRLHDTDEATSPVVKTWLKHCSRALIGRLALRVTRWDYFGANPLGHACITRDVDAQSGVTRRYMHVGESTFEETAMVEGRDSLPQVTGWIMAECRVRLWEAMCAARTACLAHVDTDSLLVNRRGLQALREAYGANFGQVWQVKGAWRRAIVYGPRNYRVGHARKVSGVPRKAREVLPNVFEGERWLGVSLTLEDGDSRVVVVEPGRWELTKGDTRRESAAGTETRAIEVQLAGASSVAASSSSRSGVGA